MTGTGTGRLSIEAARESLASHGGVLYDDLRLGAVAAMVATAATPVDCPDTLRAAVTELGVSRVLDALDTGVGLDRLVEAIGTGPRTTATPPRDCRSMLTPLSRVEVASPGHGPKSAINGTSDVTRMDGLGGLNVPLSVLALNPGLAGRLPDGSERATHLRRGSGIGLSQYLAEHRLELARIEALVVEGETRGTMEASSVEDATRHLLVLVPSAQARYDDVVLLGLAGRIAAIAPDALTPVSTLASVVALLRGGQGDVRLARATIGKEKGDALGLPALEEIGAAELTRLHDELAMLAPRRAAELNLERGLDLAHAGEIDQGARLIAVAALSSDGLDDDFFARSCLAEGWLAARLGASSAECEAYLENAWQLFSPFGVRPFVRALAHTIGRPGLRARSGMKSATLSAVAHVRTQHPEAGATSAWAVRPYLRDLRSGDLRQTAVPRSARELLLQEPDRPKRRRADVPVAKPAKEPVIVALQAPHGEPSADDSRDLCALLSPRELEVASHVATGVTNEQIARRLGISRWTVINHVRNVMRKLEVSSRVEVATRFAAGGLTVN